jgi:hypothetical protein
MKTMRLLLPATVLLAAACQVPPRAAETLVLWDGGPLTGWKMAGPGTFVVEDGAIRAAGGMGLLWYAAEEFGDFRLELEWMVEEVSDNSGVFVRFPDPGDDPWVAVNAGYEIQICDMAGPESRTGAIYSFCPSSHVPTRPAGEWNQYAITVTGQDYVVQINGETVNRFQGFRGERGFIGLQNHDDGSPVRFRNLRITRL